MIYSGFPATYKLTEDMKTLTLSKRIFMGILLFIAIYSILSALFISRHSETLSYLFKESVMIHYNRNVLKYKNKIDVCIANNTIINSDSVEIQALHVSKSSISEIENFQKVNFLGECSELNDVHIVLFNLDFNESQIFINDSLNRFFRKFNYKRPNIGYHFSPLGYTYTFIDSYGFVRTMSLINTKMEEVSYAALNSLIVEELSHAILLSSDVQINTESISESVFIEPTNIKMRSIDRSEIVNFDKYKAVHDDLTRYLSKNICVSDYIYTDSLKILHNMDIVSAKEVKIYGFIASFLSAPISYLRYYYEKSSSGDGLMPC